MDDSIQLQEVITKLALSPEYSSLLFQSHQLQKLHKKVKVNVKSVIFTNTVTYKISFCSNNPPDTSIYPCLSSLLINLLMNIRKFDANQLYKSVKTI